MMQQQQPQCRKPWLTPAFGLAAVLESGASYSRCVLHCMPVHTAYWLHSGVAMAGQCRGHVQLILVPGVQTLCFNQGCPSLLLCHTAALSIALHVPIIFFRPAQDPFLHMHSAWLRPNLKCWTFICDTLVHTIVLSTQKPCC